MAEGDDEGYSYKDENGEDEEEPAMDPDDFDAGELGGLDELDDLGDLTDLDSFPDLDTTDDIY